MQRDPAQYEQSSKQPTCDFKIDRDSFEASAGLHAEPLYWFNYNLDCGGKKTGEQPSEQDENQQQSQPTYGSGLESNPANTDGRRALLTLHHKCSPKSFN